MGSRKANVFAHVWGNIFREGLQLDLKVASRQVGSNFPLTDLGVESVEDFLVDLDQILHQLATGRIYFGGFFHFNTTKHVHVFVVAEFSC